MRNKSSLALAIQSFALLFALATAYPAMAEDAPTSYPKMAPFEQYLMDRNAEIAMARKAAPPSISHDAEVLVLGRQGFATAEKGNNGFVCMVARGWTSAADADFWNPKVRVPICFNAAAARTFLVRYEKMTDLILAGRSKDETEAAMNAAVAKKELAPMESGAMCYMMSKEGYAGDTVEHWHPHVMFFYSDTDPATWGANLPGSPVFGLRDDGEHLTQFAVGVTQWSDGTSDHGSRTTPRGEQQ